MTLYQIIKRAFGIHSKPRTTWADVAAHQRNAAHQEHGKPEADEHAPLPELPDVRSNSGPQMAKDIDFDPYS